MKRNIVLIRKESRVIPWLFLLSWEQREFRKLFDLLTNNTLSRAELNDETGSVFNVHYGDILVKFGEIINMEKDRLPYISDSSKIAKSAFLMDGDVIIADTAEDSTVGKCVEIMGVSDNSVASGLHTIPCRPRKQFAQGYLGYFMNSPAFHDQLLPLMQGTKVTSVSKSSMADTLLCYPTDVAEQARIGQYFMKLDDLITLHQRQGKQSIYKPSQMFRETTSAWEQRKLGEIVGIYDGVHQTPDYQDRGIMFLSVENISTLQSNKYITEEAFERDYKIFPELGDILMTRIGDVGTPNVIETSEKIAYYVSLALLKPQKSIDSYYLCNAIQSPFFQKGLRDRTLLTAIPQKINKDEIGKVDVFVPSSIDEQQKIGRFFRNVNNLITLHQRELERLQNIKKACLEKMFV